jgi:metal-responsive CopG/Arc/MetJ family transcriptional regulator
VELQSYTRVVTFKIDPQMLEKLDKLARELSMSRSELIREAINEFLLKLGPFSRSDENKNDSSEKNPLEIEVLVI